MNESAGFPAAATAQAKAVAANVANLPPLDTYFVAADPAGLPNAVTGFALSGAVKGIIASWALPPEAKYRSYLVYSDTVPITTPPAPASLVLETNQTVVTIPYKSTTGLTYVGIVAKNTRGELSAPVSGSVAYATAGSAEIAASAVTADKIAANAVTAVKVAAGTLTADKLAAGTITSASACIASLDAAKITAGTLDTTKATIAGGGVLLNASGVTVNQGNFLLNEDGNLNALRADRNMLNDHGFELLRTDYTASDGGDCYKANLMPGVSPWQHTAPAYMYVMDDSGSDIAPRALFGNVAARVSPSDYGYWNQVVPVRGDNLTGPYTLSLYYAQYANSPTAGAFTVNAYMDFLDSTFTLISTASGSSSDTFAVGSRYIWKRMDFTASAPAGTMAIRVRFHEGGTRGFVLVDGVQLVPYSTPLLYSHENSLQSHISNPYIHYQSYTSTTITTFTNGWSAGVSKPVVIYKFQDGLKKMEGGITGGTIGQPAFTIPLGFRPVQTSTYVAVNYATLGTAFLNVLDTGVVTQISGLNTGTTFPSITFM